MAYIAPNSTIRFHKNIVLDDTYDHTYYFDSIAAQNAFFTDSTKVLFQLDNYSYQRHTSNSLRIARPVEDVMNCSYISFKNTSFENKWFYAFLTDYEYVNNSTTIIYYEIDVMQTFMFDVEWKQCYIERQHTVTDNIGDNTIPEDLELGEYVYQDMGIYRYQSGYYLVVAASYIIDYDPVEAVFLFNNAGGDMYSGVYSGVYYNLFDLDEVGIIDNLSNMFKDIADSAKQDGIVSIFMLPKDFFTFEGETPRLSPKNSDRVLYKDTHWNIGLTPPKNKKLYTYPYSLLYVDNGQGNSAQYRWEFFSTDTVTLRTYYGATCSPEMMLVPLNYNGVTINYNERLIIDNFTQCAYTIDSYRAWLAQNSTRLNLSMGQSLANAGFSHALTKLGYAGGALAAIGGIATGNPIAAIGGAMSAIGTNIKGVQNKTNSMFNVAQMLNEKRVASLMPPHVSGTQSNTILTGTDNIGFRCYNVHVRPEYARIIDDYFTRYGYAIHQNAVPNLCARTRFTYVKTVDCTIEAEIANEYTQKIVSIMNNGITFWNDKTYIGNYELANNVISG